MAHLSIRNRLLLLVALFFVLLVGATGYVASRLQSSGQAVERATNLVGAINSANKVRAAFNEYRYWVTDLAVSLLRQSELNAANARESLNKALDELSTHRRDLASTLRAEVDQFSSLALRAVDEYTDDQRVVGNTFLAQAREHSVNINNRISALVEDLNRDFAGTRDAVQRDVQHTIQVTFTLVSLAMLLGLAATFFVWRSIAAPLRNVTEAMAGVSAGRLDTPIPEPTDDEIGSMARTLALFRESLVERERLTRERDQQRRMVATALETISDGFILCDADDRLVICNSRFREMFREIRDEAVPGAQFSDLVRLAVERGMIDPGRRSAEEWIAHRMRQHLEPKASVEYFFRGTWMRISERHTPDGGIVGVYSDITELMRRQEDLEGAMQQAEAANRAKSAFLANMSHELRTPLNSIIGLTEMLADNALRFGTEKAVEPLRRVLRAGRHLLNLINEILDLSKIEAGKFELNTETVAIAPLVDEVIGTSRPLADQNRNQLLVECPADIGALRVDPVRLRQVLLNLLSNACKFTSNGEVKLSVARVNEDGRERLRFDVVDSGIGIASDQLGKLFQEFTQADTSTSRQFGGSGLGLAISRRLCLLMGGDISVQSEEGRGSTFTVRLPAGGVTDAPVFPLSDDGMLASASFDRNVRGRTILVIDDDATARELIAGYLQDEGFDVVTAANGVEALKRVREIRPIVITLDVMMPDLDGWTVLSALKGDPDLASIPVIMVTIVDERQHAFALGATGYLLKPIERAQLVRLLAPWRAASRPTRVLVVEDDSNQRVVISTALADPNWEVVEAENGRVGFEKMREGRPDVVILDIMMPEMDGFEFMAELQNHPDWREIPVFVVTALDLTEQDRERLNVGVEKVLSKASFSARDLVARVRAVLRQGPRAPAPETVG